MKYVPKWTEAFIILSVTWTFGMVLKKPAKEYLAKLLQKRIQTCVSDFASYKRMKNKQFQMNRGDNSQKGSPKVSNGSPYSSSKGLNMSGSLPNKLNKFQSVVTRKDA